MALSPRWHSPCIGLLLLALLFLQTILVCRFTKILVVKEVEHMSRILLLVVPQVSHVGRLVPPHCSEVPSTLCLPHRQNLLLQVLPGQIEVGLTVEKQLGDGGVVVFTPVPAPLT